MTKKKDETKKDETKKETEPKINLAMTKRGFEPTCMDDAWRMATALANSELVPLAYRNKPASCLIAIDLALRLRSSWLMVMQHVYDVKGRLSLDAQFCIALINQSGLFTDPLDYEIEGTNPFADDYKVRATAQRKKTGKVLYGPWIDWKLVKAEGWYGKDGSKWKTMPEQMFHYRAASWFANRHCPEVKMGMMTSEEAEEIPPMKHVESFDKTQEATVKNIEDKAGSEPVDVSFDKKYIPTEIESQNVDAKRTKPETSAPEEKKTDDKKQTTKKATKKSKKPDSLYICLDCRKNKKTYKFDTPKISGSGENQKNICPVCLSANIKETKDLPEFMND